MDIRPGSKQLTVSQRQIGYPFSDEGTAFSSSASVITLSSPMPRPTPCCAKGSLTGLCTVLTLIHVASDTWDEPAKPEPG